MRELSSTSGAMAQARVAELRTGAKVTIASQEAIRNETAMPARNMLAVPGRRRLRKK